MPKTSFTGVVNDWEDLLSTCQESKALLGDFDRHQGALIALLHRTKTLKKRQELLEAARQASTKQLGEAIAEGKEEARRLRRLIGARLGTDNSTLVDFGVAPIRKRGPRRPERAQE
jgi:hypothetical protein